MRTTIILREDLVKKAMEVTGIKEKTALVHRGLEALIQGAAIQRLIKLGGSHKAIRTIPRRREKE